MSHDEKSQAQKDKDAWVKKVEDKLEGEYDKAFKEHQSAAEGARGDQPDNVETEEEYRERIANVPGLFSDSYAYGVDQNKADDLKEAAGEATDDDDSDDDDSDGNDVGGDPKVAKAAAKTSPASDATKPATALQNQKKEEKEADKK